SVWVRIVEADAKTSAGPCGTKLLVMPFSNGGVPVARAACEGHESDGATPTTPAADTPLRISLRMFGAFTCSDGWFSSRASRPSIEITTSLRGSCAANIACTASAAKRKRNKLNFIAALSYRRLRPPEARSSSADPFRRAGFRARSAHRCHASGARHLCETGERRKPPCLSPADTRRQSFRASGTEPPAHSAWTREKRLPSLYKAAR